MVDAISELESAIHTQFYVFRTLNLSNMMAVDDFRPLYAQSYMSDLKEGHISRSKTPTIHSGHFMASRVHDINNEDDEDSSSSFRDDLKGFDFVTANRETYTTYNFSATSGQPVNIDASLTKLFECMTLAYSGKITSPRWKQFRGLHLSQKQRIRLNNLIWREWHMQYIFGMPPMVCQFAMPLSDHTHSRPEAVVMEGKYWKRQLDVVTAEYKKWRRYFKERVRRQSGMNFWENCSLSEWELLDRVKDVTYIPHRTNSYTSNTDLNLSNDDITDMDLTNELFALLNQGFAFPDPRERSQLSCADLIQPCLMPLQPILEEFMDIDSLPEFPIPKTLSSVSSSTFTADTSTSFQVTVGGLHNPDLSLGNFLTSSASTTSDSRSSSARQEVSSPTPANNFIFGTAGSSAGSPQNLATFQLIPEGQYRLDSSVVIAGSQESPSSITLLPAGLYSSIQSSASSDSPPHKNAVASNSLSSDLLIQLIEYHQRLLQLQPSTEATLPAAAKSNQQSSLAAQLSQSPQHQQPVTYQPVKSIQSPVIVQPQSSQAQPSNRSWQQKSNISQPGLCTAVPASSVQSATRKQSASRVDSMGKKKDGPFTVPTVKPAPRKQHRLIAATLSQATTTTPSRKIPGSQSPKHSSPSSSPSSSQGSLLGELLKSGTYPGALINVKEESPHPAAASSPIKTTTNFYQHAVPSYSPQFGQDVLSTFLVAKTAAAASPSHASLPLLAREGFTDVGGGLVTDQVLGDLVLTDSQDSDLFPLTAEKSPTGYYQGVETSSSSVSIVPTSPVSSPPDIKRTMSPVHALDMSSYGEPVSPFSTLMPLSPAMPLSPSGLACPESPESSESSFPFESRRSAHLSAEQKRRCNLKTGFDLLQQLVPSLSQNPKVSKATMLQKTAEYCKKLKAERAQMQKESTLLKQEIEALNSAISMVQSQLPETGVPVTRQRKDQMKEMFDAYVRMRTQENSKFWIFSVVMSTLYDTYCNSVATSNLEEFWRTSLRWLDQSCSLVTLRPDALNALRKLSTSTPILTEPQKMKEFALQAVASKPSRYKSDQPASRRQ